MGSENQEIKIVGVDKEGILTGQDRNDFWVIPFTLSSAPDDAWQRKFYEVQQKNSNPMKRKAQVEKDCIKAQLSGADDLQKVLDVLKTEVLEANALCEEDYQRKMQIRRELEILQKERNDATLRFQEDSDKLVF